MKEIDECSLSIGSLQEAEKDPAVGDDTDPKRDEADVQQHLRERRVSVGDALAA